MTDGKLHLEEVGSPLDLALPVDAETAKLIEGYPPSLVDMEPRRFPQNWGSDPDLTQVAKLSASLFEERTGRRVDGVAYADPKAFAAIVGLTGPQTVVGTDPPVRVTDQSAARFLMADQFEQFSTEPAANAATKALIHDVFEALTNTQLPSPRGLGDQFGPLVDQGRLAFTSLHPEDRALLAKMGTERRMPAIDGTNLLGLVERNANPSKIDYYLHRSATASYRWNPKTGAVAGEVTVRLRNDAPSRGLSPVVIGNELGEPLGTNVTDLALLTRFALDGVTVDGKAVQAQPTAVGTYWRDTVRVAVPAGKTVVVRYRIRGTIEPGTDHHLQIVGQPMANPTSLSVTVRTVDGREVVGEEGAGASPASDGGATVVVPEGAHRQLHLKVGSSK